MADEGKIARIVNLYRRFNSWGQLTVKQIMGDYEVDRRTVNRDLKELQELFQIELENERSSTGEKIWRLKDRDKKIEVCYRLWDLTALHLGRRLFDFLEDTALEASLSKVYERIEEQLKRRDEWERAKDLHKKVYMVSEGPKKLKRQHADILDTILTGLLKEEQLTIRYVNLAGKSKDLQVKPYTLVAFRRGLYLLAAFERPESLRTFALERIAEAEWLKGEKFTVPSDYDPEKHFESALFIKPGKPDKVTLRFSKGTDRFIELRRFHKSQTTKLLPDGRTEMTLQIPCGEEDWEVLNWVISFGPYVEVVEPEGLRQRVKEHLERALANYK